jgi:hypothetical protein
VALCQGTAASFRMEHLYWPFSTSSMEKATEAFQRYQTTQSCARAKSCAQGVVPQLLPTTEHQALLALADAEMGRACPKHTANPDHRLIDDDGNYKPNLLLPIASANAHAGPAWQNSHPNKTKHHAFGTEQEWARFRTGPKQTWCASQHDPVYSRIQSGEGTCLKGRQGMPGGPRVLMPELAGSLSDTFSA